MNKKFSTLVAAFLSLGTFATMNAANVDVNPTAVTDVKGTKYYFLGTSTTEALQMTKHDGKDSVKVASLSNLDFAHADSMLWQIKKVSQEVSGSAVYTFVNKATGSTLKFAKKDGATSIIASGLDQWAWTPGQALYNKQGNDTYTVALVGGQVKVKKAGQSAGQALTVYSPKASAMSAADLNDYSGAYFELSFASDVKDNPFTGKKLVAEGNGEFYKLAYYGVKAGYKKDKPVYIYVDNAYYSYQSVSDNGKTGAGYKFTTDTTVVIAPADKEQKDFGKLYVEGANMFKVIKHIDDVTGDRFDIQIQDVPYTTDNKVFSSYKVQNANATPYVAWASFAGGPKVLSTGIYEANVRVPEYPVITLKEGTKANLNTKVAYIVTDARETIKSISRDDNEKLIANPFKGQAFGANCEENIREYVYTSANWYTQNLSQGERNYLLPVLTDGNETVATNHWVVSGENGVYTIANRVTEDKLIVGNETTNATIVNKKMYVVGENTYAIAGTSDTIKMVPVTNASKYVGYKHFDVLSTFRVALNVVSEGLGDDIFVVEGKDDATAVKSGITADESVKFYPEAVKLVGFGKYGTDSLTYSAYNLKADNGKYFNTEYLSTYPSYAYLFQETGVEGQYKMIVAHRYGMYSDEKTYYNYSGSVLSTSEFVIVDDETGELLGDSEENAITLELNRTTGRFEIADEDAKMHVSYEPYYVKDKNKVAVNVTTSTLGTTYLCNTTRDIFSLVEGKKDAYAEMSMGHKIISTIADDGKAVTMDGEGFASTLREGQSLGDTSAVVPENLSMWLDTACLANPVMPLYYIATSRGLSDEDKAANKMNYLVSLTDSVADKKYTVVSGVKKVRLGFVKGEIFATDTLVFGPEKADTVDVEASPAAVAFVLTDNEGEYMIELPNLTRTQQKVYTGEDGQYRDPNNYNYAVDEWNNPIMETVAENDRYFAVNNDVMYLTNRAGAYKFTVEAVEAPTSNEGIEAESSVKVIAGNGTVTVQGAAGQTVTIATVLGKAVANEVVASDNATIAAPAGVVFVTVNGETTKVVVK